MKTILLFLVLISLTACTNSLTSQGKTVESADAAYNQLDLKQSRKILNDILENDSIDNDTQCKVLQRLAAQDWKYFKNYDLAKSRLMIAESIGISISKTWNTLSRIERESGNYQNSLMVSENAEKHAESASEKLNAKLEYAQTVYDLSINNINNNIHLDTALLCKTSNILVGILELNAGSPKPSKLLLGISLLQNNGTNVMKAWKSYFQIQDIKNTNSYLSIAAKDLNEVCENWNGEPLLVENQGKLILALSSSRFYEFAGDYALCNSCEKYYSQVVKDILIYSKYLKSIKSNTDEYYRLIAIGEESKREYKKWLNDTLKELWMNLSFISGKKFSNSNFLDETRKHFGTMASTGSTSNYNGYVLFWGHIVNQEKAIIEQYSYKSEFTYTQIDMMISNGYSSWFWENKAIGGWATEYEIVRVREVYLDEPFDAWESITDSIELQKTKTLIDEFINQANSAEIYEHSAGLAAKLRFDALNDLYNKIYSEGLQGNALKLAFLSNYEQYRQEASLIAHEGRHSIEKKYLPGKFKKWSMAEREFHAKLSQIVFATEPRLELSGMLNDFGVSGHGLANKKIADVAINWIENNNKQIKGFSSDKSLFSQLYLLTKDQIKKCYKSADPLFVSQ